MNENLPDSVKRTANNVDELLSEQNDENPDYNNNEGRKNFSFKKGDNRELDEEIN